MTARPHFLRRAAASDFADTSPAEITHCWQQPDESEEAERIERSHRMADAVIFGLFVLVMVGLLTEAFR